MLTLLPLLLLAPSPAPAAAAPVKYPRTFLASVVDLPLQKGESVAGFTFSMWNVEVWAVCRLPTGWKIKAGGDTSPDRELSGEGSQTSNWLTQKNPPQLANLVLVRLRGPVERAETRKGPATFKGIAVISTGDGERRAALGYRNISLKPATGCPSFGR
ncbi:hypothetical protein [Sphingomonas quercus]|uniref:DUF3455 domain-containing protein n=1 Tax=Sphingomonas quercus TaxID=2842451 RepID=A0ABS6BDL7_9SPHN|nr:hypothetical protein [Sphingomonas quercus]MBU3076411.1 hypothetical protein [Sphingomonas quercus]